MRRLLVASLLCVLLFCMPVQAGDLKGRVTVYSDKGKTKLETDTRYGICASGNKDLLGKYVILYQRFPDESRGECLGIFHVEDTGCHYNVIDIWCPESYQKMIRDRTYENGCEGRIYIQVVNNFE